MWAANSASHKRCQLLKLRLPEKKGKRKETRFLLTVSSRAAERRRSLTVSPHKQTKKAKELRTRSFPRGTSGSNSLRTQQWKASSSSSFIFIFSFCTSNESLKFSQSCALAKLENVHAVAMHSHSSGKIQLYFVICISWWRSRRHLQCFSVFLQCV